MSVLKAALKYAEDGLPIIPVPHQSKNPTIKGWQNLRIGVVEVPRYFYDEPQNIGVILGPAGDTDIDIDCAEAIETAPFFMPRTRRFGHASKPLSHYWYKSPGLAESETVAAQKLTAPNGGGGILELRTGGGDRGAQTIIPPSTHVSGEPIEWEDDTPIATVSPDELRTAFYRTGAAALLARFF
jgi:hypothetical protein